MNNFNFEKEKSPERFTSRIVLKFFRHAEQEPGNKEKSDFERRLTATGREQAIKKSKIQDIEQAVAFGSPRKRAQETAGFVMAGKQEEITGKESLEGLKEKLDKKIKVGSKIAVDERLDFPVGDWDSKYVQEVFSAFKKSEGLKFIVEQSDKLAEKLNDNEN
ncbi:histidine phosphatase family protein, partial [Patescibacteria group bacterium]|nr:histidine phosphatase family protein [Patescibacteria group bacterium]